MGGFPDEKNIKEANTEAFGKADYTAERRSRHESAAEKKPPRKKLQRNTAEKWAEGPAVRRNLTR